MSISAKLRRAPTRIATGAFILNSGLGKLHGDQETAKQVHGMATDAFPGFERVDPKLLVTGLGVAETALGAALLLPIVPAALAGAALAAFSGGLLGLYWRSPGMHAPNSPLPTERGLAFAKDVWMAAIAAGLIVDSATSPAHDLHMNVAHELRDRRRGAGMRVRSARARIRSAVHR